MVIIFLFPIDVNFDHLTMSNYVVYPPHTYCELNRMTHIMADELTHIFGNDLSVKSNFEIFIKMIITIRWFSCERRYAITVIFWRKFSLDRCQDKFKHLPIPRRHAGVKRFHVNRLVTLYLDTRTFNLMWIEVLSLPYCLHHSYAFSLLPEAWLEFLKSLQIDEISI